MTEGAPFEGTQMVAEPLSDEVAAQRAARAVSQPPNNLGDFWRVAMRPDEGYINVVSLVRVPRRRYCLHEPSSAKPVQLVEDSRFEALQNHVVGMLYLAVRLWVRHHRQVHTYVEVVVEFQEFLACELGACYRHNGRE